MDKLVQVKWEIVDGERFFSIGVAYISEIENRDRLTHGGGVEEKQGGRNSIVRDNNANSVPRIAQADGFKSNPNKKIHKRASFGDYDRSFDFDRSGVERRFTRLSQISRLLDRSPLSLPVAVPFAQPTPHRTFNRKSKSLAASPPLPYLDKFVPDDEGLPAALSDRGKRV